MFAVLKMGKLNSIATEDDMYTFTVSVSTGEKKFEQIVESLKPNTQTL
mgnify:FL=1